jgi:hypothetical protein
VNAPLATTAFNTRNPRMREFAAELIGMEVELEDKLVFGQNAAGAYTNTRVLPTGTALLSVRADDNDPFAMDWGNAVVVESRVAGMVGMPNLTGGEQYGPMGYYTSPHDLNPPNLTAWGVARGFPRKFRKTCTAIFTGL